MEQDNKDDKKQDGAVKKPMVTIWVNDDVAITVPRECSCGCLAAGFTTIGTMLWSCLVAGSNGNNDGAKKMLEDIKEFIESEEWNGKKPENRPNVGTGSHSA